MNALFSHPVLHVGDPTVLGWVITLMYLLLALKSYFNAKVADRRHEAYRFWWSVCYVFLLLGINKQLDLQTSFLKSLKELAIATGLQSQKSVLKVMLVVFVACLLIGCAWLTKRTLAESIKRHKIVWLGLLLLFVFIFARTVIFNHLLAHLETTERWSAWLELSALLLIGYGLLTDQKSAHFSNSTQQSTLKTPVKLAHIVDIAPDVVHAHCPACGAQSLAIAIHGRKFICKGCGSHYQVRIAVPSS